MARREDDPVKYLEARTVMRGNCIEWTGYLRNGGYGAAVISGRSVLAHRLAYEIVHGEIPSNMLVCHHCDNRKCVRIDHLFLGTIKTNAIDMASKGRANKKLTAAQVKEIATSSSKGRDLAHKYGVSESMISMIRHGSTRHVALSGGSGVLM